MFPATHYTRTCIALMMCAASPQAFALNSTDPAMPPIGIAAAQTDPAQPNAVAVVNVCFYDIDLGAGNATQIPPITAAGHVALNIAALDAAALAPCNVLFAHNASNGGYNGSWSAGLAAVQTRVNSGMALVFHDRNVELASANIPGLAASTCIRDFADDTNIDIVTAGTTVTNGPGGALNGTSLDGGNSSSHGFCTQASLPVGNINILSRTIATESTTFSYPLGAGCVVYSTSPLDFYLEGSGNNPPRDNFNNLYAPNVIAYAANNCALAAAVPVLPAGLLASLAGGLLSLGGLALRRRS